MPYKEHNLSSPHWLSHCWIQTKMFLSSSEAAIKEPVRNHTSFNHIKHKNDMELSKEFLEIKHCNGTPKTKLKVLKAFYSFNLSNRRCFLFLKENYQIWTYKEDNLLNKRTKTNSCRQRFKFKFANCEPMTWRQIHSIRYHYNANVILYKLI